MSEKEIKEEKNSETDKLNPYAELFEGEKILYESCMKCWESTVIHYLEKIGLKENELVDFHNKHVIYMLTEADAQDIDEVYGTAKKFLEKVKDVKIKQMTDSTLNALRPYIEQLFSPQKFQGNVPYDPNTQRRLNQNGRDFRIV